MLHNESALFVPWLVNSILSLRLSICAYKFLSMLKTFNWRSSIIFWQTLIWQLSSSSSSTSLSSSSTWSPGNFWARARGLPESEPGFDLTVWSGHIFDSKQKIQNMQHKKIRGIEKIIKITKKWVFPKKRYL